MPEFIHLHTHTEFSLLDGANKVDNIAKAAHSDGQAALAITDHGNMYGVLNFYNACEKHNIKPIVGCEVYIAQGNRRRKHTRHNKYNHLTLLARDNVGYKNLLYLTSISFIEGLSSRPRIDLELLSRHTKGITCLSGCLSGQINELIRAGYQKDAELLASHLRDMFGKEYFYIEVQRNGLTIQDEANEGLVKIAKRLNLDLVATNDIHYLRKEDCDFQDTMLCVATGSRKSNPNRFKFDTQDVYFKTSAEMYNVFRDIPEAVKNTCAVAEAINIVIPQGKPIFPDYGLEDPKTELENLVGQGLKRRYGTTKANTKRIQDRARMELDTISEMGYAEYFLVVRDFVETARDRGIPVGPGRGSAAGSIVSYALGITSVDPIKFNLIFERFLNSSRVGLPDIDIDFCKDRRDEIIDYLKERHGDDRVAHIATFGTFGARGAFRNAARVQDLSLPETDQIAKKFPPDLSIDEAFQKDQTLAADYKKHGLVFDTARAIEGYVSHFGVHASGIVIGNGPLHETIPICKSDRGVVCTQWDGDACEKVGLVKFDFLGLQTLTVISRAQALIQERHGKLVNFDKLEMDDPEVFNIFKQGDTEGVFQCFSDGMRRLLIEMQPDRFDDIVAAIALFRPGPLESNIVKSFIDRKHGKEEIKYPHSSVAKFLSNTYGTMVYQEQIMQLAGSLAGFDMKEADELRKAIGKKKMNLLTPIKKKWLNGCKITKKISESKAKDLWEDILKFGRYGFNLSHSTCYAFLSYYTAYLKTKYPVEFYAANISAEADDGNTDKMVAFIHDAAKHGIGVLPPDIRTCTWYPTVEDEHTLRIGLGCVKGIGRDTALRLSEIGFGNYSNIMSALKLTDSSIIRKNTLESLIKSGAMDYLGVDRGILFKSVPKIVRSLSKLRKKPIDQREPIFGEAIAEAQDPEIPLEDTEPWTRAECLKAERDVYDFYLTEHPMKDNKVATIILGARPIQDIIDNARGLDSVRVCGIITLKEVRTVKSGKNAGKKYARIIIEDGQARLVCMVFTDVYRKTNKFIEEAYDSAKPVVISGKVDTFKDIPQVITARMRYLDDISSKDHDIVVDVGGNYSTWEHFAEVMKENPGDSRVSLKVTDALGTVTIIRTDYLVSLNEAVLKEISATME
jgi:DNA polymerase-3 subunit alpha